jgi:spermidine synthase
VIELSQGVVDAAAFFSHINFDILRNPRVRIRLDDGRNFLERVRTPYDVITADAIIPRHAGANSLNSVEYFRLVRDALAPNGIALHWNGGATEPEYQLILRAFVTAFPNTTLWGDGSLMVGTREPLTLSRDRIESLLAATETRDLLRLMNIESFDHLERIFRAATPDVRTYLGPGPVLSDDRPILEYFASLPQIERDLTKMPRQSEGLVRP